MKRTFKNNIQRLFSLIICLVFIFNLAPLGENVFAENFTYDFESSGLELFTYSQGGGVEIKTASGNSFMNISPKMDGTFVFAEYGFKATNNNPVELSYDFKINNYLNNENILADISQDIDKFLEIRIKDNALMYKKANGKYEKLTNECLVNKWYNLRLNLDFAQNMYSVYIDDTCVLRNQISLATYPYAGKDVKLSFSSKYSPGFAIDNFVTKDVITTNRLKIVGDTYFKVADGESASKEYTIYAYDASNMEIPQFQIGCMIKPETAGVSTSVQDNIVTVTIDETVPTGSFEFYVTSGTKVSSAMITVERYAPTTSSMKIKGEARVAYGYFDNQYAYTVETKDQQGNVYNRDNLIFTLEGDVPENITVDRSTGVVTVLGELPKDVHIILRAEVENNPVMTATKKLTLQDSASYETDNRRFETLIRHIENIYDYAGDKTGGSPLIAMTVDRINLSPGIWYDENKSEYIPCEIAGLSSFLRAVDSVGFLTEDESYNKRVEDLYRFILEKGTASNGLPYWGGHTVIEMETQKANGGKYLCQELKSHFPYMDPFFRVDPEAAEKICYGTFIQHVVDWDTMELTRHGEYVGETSEELWRNQTDTFTLTEGGYQPQYTTNLGFSVAAIDFAQLAVELAKYNQDKNAVNTYLKVFDSLWKTSDPDTLINVYMNSTAGRYGYDAPPGVLDISTYTPDGKWWLLDPLPGELTTTGWGDRWWNVMGEDLIAEGYVPEEKQWLIRECYLKQDNDPELYYPFTHWDFVKAVGDDTYEGKLVIDRAIRSHANYIRYAYDEEQNNFKRIFVDGVTDITGFVVKRNGYGYSAGYKFNRSSGGTGTFLGSVYTYINGINYPEYKEYTDILWNYIQNYAYFKDYGTLGKAYPGHGGTEVNLTTTETDPNILLAFIYLYEGTGNVAYLDFARAIADNIIKENMVEGMFTNNIDGQFVYTGSSNGNYPFIFAILEATIRGEQELLPVFHPISCYREAPIYNPDTGETWDSASDGTLFGKALPKVDVKEIVLPKDEITLKVGEEYFIEARVYPNDASSKGLLIASSDVKCVFADRDKNSLIALKPGTVEITVRSVSTPLVKTKLKVTVTE